MGCRCRVVATSFALGCLASGGCAGDAATHAGTAGGDSATTGAVEKGVVFPAVYVRTPLDLPVSIGQAVCAEYRFGTGSTTTLQLPLVSGGNYRRDDIAVSVPATMLVRYFVASSPACTDEVRSIFPVDGPPAYAATQVAMDTTNQTCATDDGTACGRYYVSWHVTARRAATPSGTYPRPGSPSFAAGDGDGDRILDVCQGPPDGCPADPDKTEPRACGCGVADDDTDVDGVPDCLDACPLLPDPPRCDSDDAYAALFAVCAGDEATSHVSDEDCAAAIKCMGTLGGFAGGATCETCSDCAEFSEAIGDPCGTCDSGQLACEAGALACGGDLGAAAHNACGGCDELSQEPGTPCGTCPEHVLVCDGAGGTVCDTAVECDPCADGALGEDETDGDCGGATCPGCGEGSDCITSADCAAGLECFAGLCARPEHCLDGVVGLGEADVDCGGECGPCPLGAHCSADADCETGACSAAPPGTAHDRCVPRPLQAAAGGAMEFRFVPGGSWDMGTPDTESGRHPDEVLHPVRLTYSVFLGATEVTQGQWIAAGGVNPSCFQEPGVTSCNGSNAAPTHPVEQVDWSAAAAFANWLSDNDGDPATSPCYSFDPPGCGDPVAAWSAGDLPGCSSVTFSGLDCTGYRLPTEAELERGARAGTTGATYNGELDVFDCSPSTTLEPIAWYCGNSGGMTHPVGTKAPNAFGLYDTIGNVYDWAWDWFDEDFAFVDACSGLTVTTTALQTNPCGAASGLVRATRGGGYGAGFNQAHTIRTGNRNSGSRSSEVGFRLARTVPAASPCADGFLSAGETDVDCGGPSCTRCGTGGACTGDTDCDGSNLCAEGVCVAATCFNELHDGDEVDIDCGGDCGPCGLGARCGVQVDCAEGVCATGATDPELRRCTPVVALPSTSESMDFRYLPPGTFALGTPAGESGRDTDEPQHTVELTYGFFVAEYETRQLDWVAFSGNGLTNPSCYRDPDTTTCSPGGLFDINVALDYPVERVDWFAAAAFANWVSDNDDDPATEPCYTFTPPDCADERADWGDGVAGDICGAVASAGPACGGYRLPTEAEWEYAARATTTAATYAGDLDDLVCSSGLLGPIAWYCGNAGGKTQPSGTKTPNAFGLHDMLGNVWEWADDWYDADYAYTDACSGGAVTTGAPQRNPCGAATGTSRSSRGASYASQASRVRAANRSAIGPTSRYNDTGFRLVRTVPASCGDGLSNQDETDVDCGGTVCGGCTVGDACETALDCSGSLACVAGICEPPASCADGLANGDETDVDCGGTVCDPCTLAARCASDLDCEDGYCSTAANGSELDRCAPRALDAASGGPLDFRYVPASAILIGSPLAEVGRAADEAQHSVQLTRDVFVAATEVTQGQWALATGGSNPSCFQDALSTSCTMSGAAMDKPVERVDWYAAAAFANWLSANDADSGTSGCYNFIPSMCADSVSDWADGRAADQCVSVTYVGPGCSGYRLPHEAEWEVAARAGTVTATFGGDLDGLGCASAVLAPLAWFCGNASGRSAAVGGRAANVWGLQDMLGNVREWTGDAYDSDYAYVDGCTGATMTTGATQVDPCGPAGTASRTTRVGSITSTASLTRAATRWSTAPGLQSPEVGFRLVRTSL